MLTLTSDMKMATSSTAKIRQRPGSGTKPASASSGPTERPAAGRFSGAESESGATPHSYAWSTPLPNGEGIFPLQAGLNVRQACASTGAGAVGADRWPPPWPPRVPAG